MKKVLVLVLTFMLVLSSCSVSSNENQPEQPIEKVAKQSDNVESESTGDFSYDDFLEDYDYFWDTIEENYPFLGVVERSGIDLDIIKNRYRGFINEATNLSNFSKTMNMMIGSFNHIGHMSIIPPEGVQYYIQIYSNSVNESKPSHFNYLLEVSTDPKTIKSYGDILGEEITFDFDKDNPTDNHDDSSQISDTNDMTSTNIETEILDEGKIAYVKYSGFDYLDIENDSDILRPFYESVKDYPHIILDIRGNGGGSDRYWYNNIFIPLLKKPIMHKVEFFINATPEIKEYIKHSITEDKLIPLDDYRQFTNANADDLKHLTHVAVVESRIPSEGDMELYNPVGFEGKLWLLVDKSVYSSSETFTMLCKSTGFAEIVGINTGGDGGGIDPMIFALPNTGLLWRNSVLYSVNPDGSNNEEFGTTPDILINEGENALDVCLNEINKEQ